MVKLTQSNLWGEHQLPLSKTRGFLVKSESEKIIFELVTFAFLIIYS